MCHSHGLTANQEKWESRSSKVKRNAKPLKWQAELAWPFVTVAVSINVATPWECCCESSSRWEKHSNEPTLARQMTLHKESGPHPFSGKPWKKKTEDRKRGSCSRQPWIPAAKATPLGPKGCSLLCRFLTLQSVITEPILEDPFLFFSMLLVVSKEFWPLPHE